MKQPHRAAVQVLGANDMVSRPKQFEAGGDGCHAGGKGNGIRRSLQRGYGLLNPGAGRIGLSGVVKAASVMAGLNVAEGCGLVDGKADGPAVLPELVDITVNTSCFNGMGHGWFLLTESSLNKRNARLLIQKTSAN